MAGINTPILTSFDLTVGVPVDMDEMIYMLSPADSPLLTGVDADGLSVLSVVPTNERQVDWMTDSLLTPRSTLAVQLNATTASTVLTVASGDRAKFSTGDILLLGAGGLEYARVTQYGTTADTLVISRDWSAGTTAVTIVTSAPVIGLGQGLPEGSDPEDSRAKDRVQYTNVCQIFGPTSIKMSKTEQAVVKYGVPNEFNRQIFLRTQENTIHREQTFLYGKKVVDTNLEVRTMAGAFTLVTTNTDATSTIVNVTTLQVAQQVCYAAGGMPDRLVINPTQLGDLNETTDTARVRQEFQDPRRGRVPVMEVWTEFGPVTVVRNRWMDTAHALLFSRDQAVRRPLRPLVMERLAKTGDSDQVQIVCEETLELKGQEHAFKFTGLT